MSVRISFNKKNSAVSNSKFSHTSKLILPRQSADKDSLYYVMWKLDRVARNEINKGFTTAFKRCTNVSEAKRFKRTLHELTQLQNNIRSAQMDHEALNIIRAFMRRF
jgi:hypothetical protein